MNSNLEINQSRFEEIIGKFKSIDPVIISLLKILSKMYRLTLTGKIAAN